MANKAKLISEYKLENFHGAHGCGDVSETDLRSINYWEKLISKFPKFPAKIEDIRYSLKFWSELAEILEKPSIPYREQNSIVDYIKFFNKNSFHENLKPPLRPSEKKRILTEIAEDLKGIKEKFDAVSREIIDGLVIVLHQYEEEIFPTKPSVNNTIGGINYNVLFQQIEHIQKSAEFMVKEENWEDKGGRLPNKSVDSLLNYCVLSSYRLIMNEDGIGQTKLNRFGQRILAEVGKNMSEDGVRTRIKRAKESRKQFFEQEKKKVQKEDEEYERFHKALEDKAKKLNIPYDRDNIFGP